MAFLDIVNFKNNADISTYIKSYHPSEMLYIDFSKKGFGFGEISLHNRKNNEFSCMNEMMSRETCIELFTSLLLNLPKEDTLEIIRHDNAWEYIDVFSEFLEKDKKEIMNGFYNKKKTQEEKDQVLIDFEKFIPTLAVESASLDVETGLISTLIKIPNSSSFCEVVINSSAVPDVIFYSAFYGENKTITLKDIEELLMSDDGTPFDKMEFLAVWISALFFKTWLKEEKLDVRTIFKEFVYVEVKCQKLKECSVQANVPAVKDLKVSFHAEEGYAFKLKVQENGVTNFIGIKKIKDISRKNIEDNAYSLTNTSGDDDLVYRAFAHVFSNLILEDEEHMFMSHCFKVLENYHTLNDKLNVLSLELTEVKNKEDFNVSLKKMFEFISSIVKENKMGWSDNDLSRFKDLAEKKYLNFGNFIE